jgi:LPS export ABC transporter protein LptC
MKALKNAVLFISASLIAAALGACNPNMENIALMEPYSGPWLTAYNITSFYSDSAIVRVKVVAKTQIQFENGDAEYPDGIFLTFYEKDGTESSTLKANRGYFYKAKNLYTAEEDVVVNSLVKKQILKTELLHWLPNEKRIFTDKFVTIETDGELISGEGLEAAEDFSTYEILRTTGSFTIKD